MTSSVIPRLSLNIVSGEKNKTKLKSASENLFVSCACAQCCGALRVVFGSTRSVSLRLSFAASSGGRSSALRVAERRRSPLRAPSAYSRPRSAAPLTHTEPPAAAHGLSRRSGSGGDKVYPAGTMAAKDDLYSKILPRRLRQNRPGSVKCGSSLDVLLSMGFPRPRA